MTAKVALVTGASRGIGKACALALAASGFDVAIAARSVQPGESREHSVTVRKSDTTELPGSLSETAEAIEKAGSRALIVPMDLTDRASVGAGTTMVLERWGGVDLVLHNGRFVGPGLMDGILDTPLESFEKFLEAHVMASLIITRMVLPGMLERGSGTVMTMTSGAAYIDPTGPPGKGGAGLGYAIGKAASHRLVSYVKAEFASRGILSYNVDPGYVSTERNRLTTADDGMDAAKGAPVEVIGAVVAWLATSPDAAALDGTNVEAQPFCKAHGLYDF
jgi:NAD(P)-dependent dehydrogenase (short-subunit alcohol dehydrogenase family)